MNATKHLSIGRLGYIQAAIMILVLLLQACEHITPTPLIPAESTSTSAQLAAEPALTPAAPTEGVLRIAMQPIVHIDPAQISSDSEVLVASHVYDYLVDVDPASKIIPRLAKDWKISEDGLTYTFTLQQGVAFHDGTPLSAKDVVWTFNRLRDPNSGFPTVDLYQNIASVEASGDLEVIFKIKQPNPFFLYDLSDNHALILKENAADPSKFFTGTGPFIVSNYNPEDRIELNANTKYWSKGQPRLAGVEVIFFNDDTAMSDALRGGQVDLVMRLATPLYESLKKEPNLTAVSIPSNKFDVVRLRSDRTPGNDPRVIQALKLATDREALFKLIQQGYGAVGRDSPIGPMYASYYSEKTAIPARDVEAAKRLLAAAGYPDGLKLELHTPDTENRPDLAAALKNQWAEAGIEVDIKVEPESVYYGDNGWLEVDLGITGWGSRPYPQFYLDVMLVCNAKWNESHFCDTEFDRLVKTAGETLDEAERVKAYQEIQRILIERGPIIVPYFSATNAAINNQFKDFQLKAFPGRTDLREVSFSK
jgi:peptide/nickel transport system substrate-binding protein